MTMPTTLTSFFVLVMILTAGSSRQLAQRGQPNLERQYTETVRPFTVKYCISCHGEKGLAAQFDLRPYTTRAAVVKDDELITAEAGTKLPHPLEVDDGGTVDAGES